MSWKLKNPDKVAAAGMRRRARKAGVFHVPYSRQEICERDSWTCQVCFKPVNEALIYPDPMSRSIHHIIDISKGGEDTPDNVCLTHLVCNLTHPRTPFTA